MTNPQQGGSLPSILCLTDACDRPETELFIGLRKAGFDVDVMCNPKGRNYQRLVDEGMVACPMALKNRFDKEGTESIRQQLAKKNYEVIHAYNPRALACGLRASRGTDIKIVAYRGVIGNISFLNPESWITFLHPRVSKIVCVADAIKDYLASLRFLWMHIPERKLQRIYKGHDLDWYQSPKADLTQFGVPEDAFVVCCTGRNTPRKGFDDLIEAIDKLPEDVDIHLLLVGDVLDNEEIQAQAAATSHPERIHFTGYRNDAPAIAAASDVFVLPSKEREGLPRAVIEAMVYGVTPVVTSVGGMPELVEDGVSGIVVEPKNAPGLSAAIERLYRDRELAASLGQAARQRIARHFHTSQTVTETGELYKSLTGRA
ncbi:glycosyltransferase family 4 protein [Marinobacter adhaerens]|uniref:Glycosyltransferase family 4 protein n=2 Tax=Marinobacter adhaerens TaxID=1033846 RepID=A0ABX8INX6_9GAMM|nr:glycosyltransferase family 4 protein [Marinobacter adhaerens]ADP96204.1 capsular polysaccharide biosynthesis protein [Marinobacter adhaerens HP15]MBW3228407.1 glycosyltransferase family 4 protein [Marinobacter adhaerens]MBW4980159.1 glycosyltransferase family 4 protein [Marinobacter adhaerens]MCK5864603.1 glycosyltransferase family 4 protein [Marinobacter adhaerens]QWV14209.1 glycosyltransferase family 4 protein [Marinobacter adhaerens]